MLAICRCLVRCRLVSRLLSTAVWIGVPIGFRAPSAFSLLVGLRLLGLASHVLVSPVCLSFGFVSCSRRVWSFASCSLSISPLSSLSTCPRRLEASKTCRRLRLSPLPSILSQLAPFLSLSLIFSPLATRAHRRSRSNVPFTGYFPTQPKTEAGGWGHDGSNGGVEYSGLRGQR